jgi:hypothetical protein
LFPLAGLFCALHIYQKFSFGIWHEKARRIMRIMSQAWRSARNEASASACVLDERKGRECGHSLVLDWLIGSARLGFERDGSGQRTTNQKRGFDVSEGERSRKKERSSDDDEFELSKMELFRVQKRSLYIALYIETVLIL